MRIISTTYLLIIGFYAAAQQQRFDATVFSPPKDWKQETTDFAVSFVTTDNKTGGWCRITVYKSISSKGNAATDFESEWAALISKQYQGASLPQPKSGTEDGWTVNSGASKFTWEGKEAVVLLNTISGYGREVSVMAMTNQDKYLESVEKFLESLDVEKPAVVQNVQQQNAVTASPVNFGITLATTNFDDGWVAKPQAAWVEVTRNQTVVRLHYGIQITDEMRNSGNMEGLLFDRLILPRFNVQNIRKYDNAGPCYFCIYFFEADGVDKISGKQCHLGFRVVTNNGVASCIEIQSPTAEDFRRDFPDQDKVLAMSGYNKFAVTAGDLAGTWTESSGAYVNMYSTVTGNYAGMNAAVSANSFTFNTDGTYSSEHKGATGMVGNMQAYDQHYQGKLTVTNWELTLTNRFKGQTDVLLAQFEAVPGGKVLHLTDKKYSGMKYHLVKEQK